MTNEASKDEDLVLKEAGVHGLITNVLNVMQVNKFKRNAEETPGIRNCREKLRSVVASVCRGIRSVFKRICRTSLHQ